MKATCIIPIFNERENIAEVINAIKKVTGINEIICVDDGSTDGSAGFIKSEFPGVKIVKLPENRGKSGAVYSGAKKAKNKLLVCIDADLKYINYKTIETALKLFGSDPKPDLLIFRMMHFFGLSKLLRHDILLSGNFIIKKSDLINIFTSRPPEGYELEIAVCLNMMSSGKKISVIPFDARGKPPIEKNGVIWTIKRDIKMYTGIVKYAGFKNLIKLTFRFAK